MLGKPADATCKGHLASALPHHTVLEPRVCHDVGFVWPVQIPEEGHRSLHTMQLLENTPCNSVPTCCFANRSKRYLLSYQNLMAIGNLQQDREVISANEIMSNSERGERRKHQKRTLCLG